MASVRTFLLIACALVPALATADNPAQAVGQPRLELVGTLGTFTAGAIRRGLPDAPRTPAMAIVKRLATGTTEFVRPGEEIEGYVLVEVQAGVAVFSRGTDRLTLRVPAASTAIPVSRPAEPAAAATPAQSAPGPASPIVATAAGDKIDFPIRMTEAEAQERIFAHLDQIIVGTAVAPNMVEGQMQGLRVTRIADPSPLRDLGLEPGDVLMAVNDRPVNDMAMLLSLWVELKDAKHVKFLIDRDGHPLTAAIDIVPAQP